VTCVRDGRVTTEGVRVCGERSTVSGRVRAHDGTQHSSFVEVTRARLGAPRIAGDCSCEVGFNCEHVAATLLEASSAVVRRSASTSIDRAASEWLRLLERQNNPLASMWARGAPAPGECLLYLLQVPLHDEHGIAVPVLLVSCRAQPRGGYAAAAPFSAARATSARPPRMLDPIDVDIIRVAVAHNPVTAEVDDVLLLTKSAGATVLEAILRTGRCRWVEAAGPPLGPGQGRRATLEWQQQHDGRQRLAFKTEPLSARIIPLDPPWYLDLTHGIAGPLETRLGKEAALLAASMPPVEAEDSASLPDALITLLDAAGLPRPRVLVLRDIAAAPTPRLRLLRSQNPAAEAAPSLDPWMAKYLDDPCRATLHFDYGGVEVGAAELSPAPIRVAASGELVRVERHEEAEQQALARLRGYGLASMSSGLPTAFDDINSGSFDERGAAVDFEAFDAPDLAMGLEDFDDDGNGLQLVMRLGPGVDNEWINFVRNGARELRDAGWDVDIPPDFDHLVLEPDAWLGYIEAEPGTKGWFDVALDIELGGEKVALLPLLQEMIGRLGGRDAKDLLARLDGVTEVMLPYGNATVCLPAARVKTIVGTLVELFDPKLRLRDGRLRLSRLRAAEIEGLQRWHGGDAQALADMAARMRRFAGVRPLAAPDGFNAQLRPYQQQGLGWLQGLRELGLGGLLADDMGLGKTVQTLAHLLIEKQAGRLRAPCLVVAPTSVVGNWVAEARRFAPALSVLVLTGAQRHARFDSMVAHDIVITSYALVRRDITMLKKHNFYYLVLDEAQALKNPRTQLRKAMAELPAQHRLCLTGTPLENHLGELWSLIDLLEPGLLGSAQQFARLFRGPIERRGDTGRRALLAQRIAPLMLRRKKQEIAGELPDKIEITQLIDLHPEQADLYETVRVSMLGKVQQALAQRGFEGSGIIVLDALLRLRQICCDPALLNIESARKVKHSAKLERLIAMLEEMVDEGRRVLVFSQFTSMLAIIEQRLRGVGLDFVMLTGNTRDREAPVARFQRGEVPVFLISLRAGGTGLNLTAADTVIHYDPWWNPAVELQATDRAHRIGQHKQVFVYHLVANGTVESRIDALKANKQGLADGLLDDASEGGALRLRAEDLEPLLRPIGL
jgi:superfamily II DNA or RNA helicase